jgi:uncharacterized YccA/Bax inhibitor family protein
MANKILEKTMNNASSEELRAGYAAPQAFDGPGDGGFPPLSTAGTSDAMTVQGAARASLVLFAILVATGTYTWVAVPESAYGLVLIVGLITALGTGFAMMFKPQLAKVIAPIYAVAMGGVLGAISKIYEDAYNGIVVQAILATGAIVFVMYTLYSTRILKVTPKFRKIVIGATLGIFVFYMLNLVLSIFGVNMPLINDTGMAGIVFSLFVIIIAASNLALDFDFIEQGSRAGLPKAMNWAAAYGLIATVVWIYLELLRLLANTRN